MLPELLARLENAFAGRARRRCRCDLHEVRERVAGVTIGAATTAVAAIISAAATAASVAVSAAQVTGTVAGAAASAAAASAAQNSAAIAPAGAYAAIAAGAVTAAAAAIVAPSAAGLSAPANSIGVGAAGTCRGRRGPACAPPLRRRRPECRKILFRQVEKPFFPGEYPRGAEALATS